MSGFKTNDVDRESCLPLICNAIHLLVRGGLIMFRYIIIFVIGFSLTFVLTGDFLSQFNLFLNIVFRAAFALFFLFIIWLLQKRRGAE